jgi:hypothetical protein
MVVLITVPVAPLAPLVASPPLVPFIPSAPSTPGEAPFAPLLPFVPSVPGVPSDAASAGKCIVSLKAFSALTDIVIPDNREIKTIIDNNWNLNGVLFINSPENIAPLFSQ